MLIATLKQLIAWRPGLLARNTAHAGAWNLARVFLQAASLLMMARHFGAAGYGALAGTVALYTTFAQLVGLGSGIALMRHLSQQGELHGKLRSTQVVYLVTSVALFLLVWPLSTWVLGDKLESSTLGLLAAAELIAAPTLLPLAFRYQAQECLWISGALTTIAPFARFVAVSIALMLELRDLHGFAVLYLTCLGLGSVAALWWFWPRSSEAIVHHPFMATVREGMPFVVSGVAVTAGNELDKTVMLRMTGDTVTGQYSAAFRVIQAAILPVNSLVLAAAPRLFRANHASFNPAFHLLLSTVAYAVLAALATWSLAPLLPWLLGPQFGPSVPILQAMCVLLLTNGVRQILVAQLTTSDCQGARNWIEGLITAGVILGMLVTIPRWGAFGAIYTLVLADLIVAGSAWLLLVSKKQRQVL